MLLSRILFCLLLFFFPHAKYTTGERVQHGA